MRTASRSTCTVQCTTHNCSAGQATWSIISTARVPAVQGRCEETSIKQPRTHKQTLTHTLTHTGTHNYTHMRTHIHTRMHTHSYKYVHTKAAPLTSVSPGLGCCQPPSVLACAHAVWPSLVPQEKEEAVAGGGVRGHVGHTGPRQHSWLLQDGFTRND
jgi:hypothetical protein